VIALSTLFLPHYLAAALAAPSLSESPWDVVIAVAVIAAVTAVRLARHSRLPRHALVLALPHPPHPPHRARARAPRPRRAAARRRARVRDCLLAAGADERLRPRAGPTLARHPLRAPPRNARLHRPRDGGEPRGGDARARQDAAAIALLLHRPRGDHDRPDRHRRCLRLPCRGRLDRPRRRMAAGADRGDRDSVRRPL